MQATLCISWFFLCTIQLAQSGVILKGLGLEEDIRSEVDSIVGEMLQEEVYKNIKNEDEAAFEQEDVIDEGGPSYIEFRGFEEAAFEQDDVIDEVGPSYVEFRAFQTNNMNMKNEEEAAFEQDEFIQEDGPSDVKFGGHLESNNENMKNYEEAAFEQEDVIYEGGPSRLDRIIFQNLKNEEEAAFEQRQDIEEGGPSYIESRGFQSNNMNEMNEEEAAYEQEDVIDEVGPRHVEFRGFQSTNMNVKNEEEVAFEQDDFIEEGGPSYVSFGGKLESDNKHVKTEEASPFEQEDDRDKVKRKADDDNVCEDSSKSCPNNAYFKASCNDKGSFMWKNCKKTCGHCMTMEDFCDDVPDSDCDRLGMEVLCPNKCPPSASGRGIFSQNSPHGWPSKPGN